MTPLRPRRLPLRIATLGAVLLMAGCASMSPEECRTADWYEQGMADGQRGQPRAYFEDHVKACGEVGISPDMARYMAGREIGIRRYCTPENGADEGRRGSYYRHSCPPELEPAFLHSYRLGREVYDAQQRLNRAEQNSRSKQRELERAKTDDEKSRLRRDLGDLDRDAERARRDLYAAERRLRSR